jgi:hypothetical protein
MRIVFTVFILLFTFLTQAQEAKGYYITLNNDTVYTAYDMRHNFFKGYDLYEELPTIDSNKRTVKFKPTDIKGFYIEMKGQAATFVSMPIFNKGRFLRLLITGPKFDVYEYSQIASIYGNKVISYALQKPDSSHVIIEASLGNIKARKRLKEFFAGDDAMLADMKNLFVQPGFTERDMRTFIQRIVKDYKAE